MAGPVPARAAALVPPTAPTLATLAPLTPFERLACAAKRPVSLDVRIGSRSSTCPIASTRLPRRIRGRRAATPSARWSIGSSSPRPGDDLDVRRRRGAGCRTNHRSTRHPPRRIRLITPRRRLPAQASSSCRSSRLRLQARVSRRQAVADSAAWCRTRFVVTGWDMLRGPERRALMPGEVHSTGRSPAAPAEGRHGGAAHDADRSGCDRIPCGSSGLTGRSLPLFPDSVHYRALPCARPGDGPGTRYDGRRAFDPDAGFLGLPACPGVSVISFG